ncbi:penicillin-binding protein activator LpoB [Opitutaceae bacterium TAV4]|uniref:penicillin-binding protein activator LpoB n=1 Tax=Geminisphaera colitermitum TaxID=1148786 RepID=UPI000158D3ED|nr:membrane protein [Geminisphaera colitermitum]RRJ95152.1 penicillin-binding protein activator LpoB [Opitutaceae bacterium TAV4]RRJ99410.1 penicillin-binding protein activator LpoB [Opitutaceae bacterium TAV3]
MKTHRHTTLLAAGLAMLLLAAGCSSRDAAYVDSKGPNTIVSLNQINIQDFNAAADDLVADLLASGVLERAPSKPAVMAVSRIVNNTQDNFDMDSLTKKIRVALYQSGKVLTTTTIAYGGSEDPLAAELGPKQGTAMPYYTLTGKIIQDTAKAGKVNQVTYSFQLTLTTVQNGLGVWEGEKQITKQGHKSAVGW